MRLACACGLGFAFHALSLLSDIDLGSAHAGSCLKDEREVALPEGSARLHSYLCRAQKADRPQLRVEFYGLSEAAAGSLLQTEHYPEIQRVIGKPKLLNNSVQAEAKSLFDTFGAEKMIYYNRLEIATSKGYYRGTESFYDYKDQRKEDTQPLRNIRHSVSQFSLR